MIKLMTFILLDRIIHCMSNVINVIDQDNYARLNSYPMLFLLTILILMMNCHAFKY